VRIIFKITTFDSGVNKVGEGKIYCAVYVYLAPKQQPRLNGKCDGFAPSEPEFKSCWWHQEWQSAKIAPLHQKSSLYAQARRYKASRKEV